MRKKDNKNATVADAVRLVPHDALYCNDSGRCPFWQLRNCKSRKRQERIAEKADIIGIPLRYCGERGHYLEFCTFLGKYLSCQDGVKDCGVNCDDPNGDYNDREMPKIARLQNREFADYYKKLFPAEADFIDRIANEDCLEYWHIDNK